MKLITNPGTNLSEDFVEAHDVEILPQQIVVDGEHHDTRGRIPLSTVDEWVSMAKTHPYVLGTSAAEFAQHFTRVGATESEQLVVSTSRQIIPSFDAAQTAQRLLQKRASWAHLSIRVVDSGTTDVGAGLATAFAAQARSAGLDLEQVTRLTQDFSDATKAAFALRSMDYAAKGGRASFLKVWAAKFLKVRPVIAFVDGRPSPVGTYRASADPADALIEWLMKAQPPTVDGVRRKVWLGVSHGQAPEAAELFADRLGEIYDVAYRSVLPLTPSIYLHSGDGALLAAVADISSLDWHP